MPHTPYTRKDFNDDNLYQYQRYLLLAQLEIETELKRVKEYTKARTSDGFSPGVYVEEHCRRINIYWQRLFVFSRVENWKE